MLTLLHGDALTRLATLDPKSIQCCVTSPPYWGLRDYGTAKWEGGDATCDHLGEPFRTKAKLNENWGEGYSDIKNSADRQPFKEHCGKCGARRIDSQLGLEKTPEEYVAKMVAVFREVRRVLCDDGTLWLNLGDSYATGGGAVGGCPGGGDQGERFLRMGHINTQPNRMKIPGLKPKDLVGIPWMVAFALRADGWYLRSDIIWAKPNCMPESVTDRPTRSHEYLFLLTKRAHYYYDAEAIKEPASEQDWENRIGRSNLNNKLLPDELHNGIRPQVKYTVNSKQRQDSAGGPFFNNAEDYAGKNAATPVHKNSKQRRYGRRHDGFNECWDAMPKEQQYSGTRNKRSVWTVPPACYPEAHFATFPPDLIKPAILAGSHPGDTILDPFAGSGTTGQVAIELGRKATLIELNPAYLPLIQARCHITPGLPLA